MKDILKKMGLTIAQPKKKIAPYIEVTIVGDSNDGDYIETHDKLYLDEYNIKDTIEAIDFLRKHLKTIYKGHFISEPQKKDKEIRNQFVDLFDVPFYCDDYCHTIEDIKLTYVNEDGLSRKLIFDKLDPFETDYDDNDE